MGLRRFLAIVAVVGARSGSVLQEPRPNLTAWKETKAAEKDAADGAVKVQKKKGAVDKAIEMLEGLQTQILAEGEAEAASYNKFACFCKDTIKEKLAAIQKGEDDKTQLSADIAEAFSKRDQLDTKIGELQDHIGTLQSDVKVATELRHKDATLYTANSEDLTGALDALEGAIQKLKASKSPSLAQLKSVSETMQTAALLADALGFGSAEASQAATKLVMLRQEPANEVRMEDYKFKSDGIIKMLENLVVQFRAEKVQVDKTEVSSMSAYDNMMQTKTDEVKAATHEMTESKKKKENAIEEIASSNQQLTTVEATLKDDKEYTNTLSSMCSEKAKTWDQRSSIRAAELQTLTQAVGIIKGTVSEKISSKTVRFAQSGVTVRLAKAVAMDAGAMEAIEEDAESAEEPASLLQLRRKVTLANARRHRVQPEDAGKEVIVNLLKNEGLHLRSTLLTSLASKIEGDTFAKVKQLIQELIEKLLQESANEASQKGWCDKAQQDASQKRAYAAEEVTTLNSEMAKLEAKRDQLTADLDTLSKELAEVKDAEAKAVAEREAEKMENGATITEAQEGLDALNLCIDLLDKFYKTAAKEKVDLSLAQASPPEDAPDAGFGNGEAYMGAQSESGGVLGMLEVMKSDFMRTVEETQVEELKAEQEHLEFMTESGKSLATKEEAESQKKEQLSDTVSKLGEAETSLNSHSTILQSTIKELMELKPVCISTGMTYEDRVSRREDEVSALNKAMCILEKYAEYGPDGASDAC